MEKIKETQGNQGQPIEHSSSTCQKPSCIAILGHHRLQNDLLAELVRSETLKTQVTVMGKTEEIKPAIAKTSELKQRFLILIDYRGVELEKTFDTLSKCSQKPDQFQVALFNLPENIDLEEFVAWPQLSGAFLSNIDQSQLIKGVNAMLDDEIWLPRKLISKYVHRARSFYKPSDGCTEKLTEREIEILKVMSTGARNIEIAESLNLSPHTVKTHIYNIFKKINASNRLQAVNWANDHIGA